MKPTGYRQNWAKDKPATAKRAGKATQTSFATKKLLDAIEPAGEWTGTMGRSARASAAGRRGVKARGAMKQLDQILGGA